MLYQTSKDKTIQALRKNPNSPINKSQEIFQNLPTLQSIAKLSCPNCQEMSKSRQQSKNETSAFTSSIKVIGILRQQN